MYAVQIRSLCVESQKLLLKQLADLDLLLPEIPEEIEPAFDIPEIPKEIEPASDIEALDDEEIVEEVHLEATPEGYSVEGDSEAYTAVELEDDFRPPVEVPKKDRRQIRLTRYASGAESDTPKITSRLIYEHMKKTIGKLKVMAVSNK